MILLSKALIYHFIAFLHVEIHLKKIDNVNFYITFLVFEALLFACSFHLLMPLIIILIIICLGVALFEVVLFLFSWIFTHFGCPRSVYKSFPSDLGSSHMLSVQSLIFPFLFSFPSGVLISYDIEVVPPSIVKYISKNFFNFFPISFLLLLVYLLYHAPCPQGHWFNIWLHLFCDRVSLWHSLAPFLFERFLSFFPSIFLRVHLISLPMIFSIQWTLRGLLLWSHPQAVSKFLMYEIFPGLLSLSNDVAESPHFFHYSWFFVGTKVRVSISR